MKQYAHRTCKSRELRVGFSVALAVVLWVHTSPAQNPAGAASQVAANNTLKLVIVGGEEPLKNLKQRVQREVIVEVRDQNDKPVGSGAAVTLALASRDGTRVTTVVTGADGRAALSFTPSATGTANINVAATLGTQTGAVAIPVNVAASLVPVAAVAGTTALGTAGAVAQTTVATRDCNGLYDPSSLTMADQVCSAGLVSPNTSPQCMAAVQNLLSQFNQLCSCVGAISVPQLYSQFGLTPSDIDMISSHVKTVGYNMPPACISPTAPTIIRLGPPTVGTP